MVVTRVSLCTSILSFPETISLVVFVLGFMFVHHLKVFVASPIQTSGRILRINA
jgi:hypothetical protein